MNEAGYSVLDKIIALIINPLIMLVFSAGVFLFMWGLVVFLFKADDPAGRKQGQQHMLWGIVGVFVMATVYGIISIIAETFGLSLPQ